MKQMPSRLCRPEVVNDCVNHRGRHGRRFCGARPPSSFCKRPSKVFWRRRRIVKDRRCGVPSVASNRSAGVASLGAALMLASCAAPPPAARSAAPAPARSRPASPRSTAPIDRARRLPELGLPLSRADPELSGDRQDAAVPRRRRQRPARPFEPARRPSVGGPDLQRPHRAARRAGDFRSRAGPAISWCSSTATTRRSSAT